MKRRGALKLAGVASAWLALPPAVRAASKPPPTPEQAIRNLGFAQSDVGYFLFDVQSKRVLEEQNANQLFLPASVSKLPTVYAALEILGADYRFPTTLRRRGSDIYLRGGGDPSLANTDLQALVAQLRAAPLTDVSTGSAVSRFIYDDSLMVSLPEITARQPVAVAYNTGLSALDVNFNRVEVDWQLKPNGRFDLRALCVADDMILPADWITFAPADPAVWADTPFIYAGDSTLDRWQYARTLPDHGSTFLPVKATAAHTARLFRALAKAGGVALPMPEPGQLPADAVEIGRVESRPLAEIIIGLLRFSNNPSAELVGLAASRKLTDESLTLGPSAAALTRWLKEQAPKANWEGFHLENHSGLSPDSRVTPRQMAQILTLVAEDDALMQAIPGLTGDGRATLADDPRGLIGKSGTMDYARGLAGYFLSKDGHPLGFAIFVFDPAQRALLDATMNPNVPVSTPAAIGWIRRALQVDQVLLASWMKTY